MELVYPGPFEAVTVNATGQTVKAGEAVKIADPGVAASLVEQGWTVPVEPVKAAKSTTKKAAPAADIHQGE